jgi:alpha-glucosidase (family GH31 glycosyl hydrolase)
VDHGLSRRSVISGVVAASAQLLFQARLRATPALAFVDQEAPAAAPGALDLTLTAMTANTLRIGIAPATGEAVDSELAVALDTWPTPLEPAGPARAHSLPWGKYRIDVALDPLRITVSQGQRMRQQISFDPDSTNVRFPIDGPLFGLGEGAHPLDRRGTRDGAVNGQLGDLRTFGAHVQIPWLMSPAGWGVFIGQPLGAFECTQTECIFRPVEAFSTRNVFLLLGDGPAQVLEEYARLTGFPHMPPRWALGYMQSHRTLASREEVLGVTKTFRDKKLPCDAVIYLGTGFCPSGWNTGHGSFTFNEEIFPDPPAMLSAMHDEHFRAVLHVVPPGNFHGTVSDTGAAAEQPGDAAPYWEKHAALAQIGVDGWWPDEGDRLSVSARFDRNRMYFEGSRKTAPDRRPFALHRNGYAGLQRFGWLWSGDTVSAWETLHAQVMIGIGAGLSGLTYWGTDIGGFVPTPELTPELFVRWFQWAAFCPLFRGHGRAWHLRLPWGWNTGDAGPKEVEGDWVAAWPPAADLHRADVEEICRKYLNLRYQLLPYLYSFVAEGHRTGLPLIRALALGSPGDPQAVAADDVYLWGDSILVAPVYEKEAKTRRLYLPAGQWHDFWNGDVVEGGQWITRAVDLETMPLYVRAGAVVPIGPIRQYADEPLPDPVTLRVYPGAVAAGGDGNFTWYDDDGISYRHEQGEFFRIECAWDDAARTLALHPDPAGKMPLPETVRVEIAGTGQAPGQEPGQGRLVTLTRKAVTLKF